MLLFGRKRLLIVLACFMVLLLLTPANGSSNSPEKLNQSHKTGQPLELNPKLSFQVKLHAFLLWSSVGFLMPVGILLIRMSSNVKSAKSVKVLFYCHVTIQSIAVILATAGAVLSIRNFENSFNNTHQRIGLALYGFIWLQPLNGFLRPDRGVKARSMWYFIHWLLGVGICIVGIANIYIGLHTYHERTAKNTRLWTVLLTVEVSFIAFIYLFQDRWNYMVKQGAILGNEQIRPTDHITYPTTLQKELGMVP